ncbi:MAG: metallopeptidase family protein [Nitrospirota bacterium]
MDRSAFKKLVQHSLRRLPRKFKQRLKNVTVEIEDVPSQALLRDVGVKTGMLFGLYHGVPLPEREWNYGNALPDRIFIYQQPIESAASSPDEIEEIVLETVMHEIGHYFGFEDDELYKIEYEKKNALRKKPRA